MKNIKLKLLLKVVFLLFLGAVFALILKDIYGYLLRAKTVRPDLVEFFQPSLNVKLVKQAAEILLR